MQFGKSRDGFKVRRRLTPVRAAGIFVCVLALPGCLPGYNGSDATADRSFVQPDSASVNRSFKANFLGVHGSPVSNGDRLQDPLSTAIGSPGLVPAAFDSTVASPFGTAASVSGGAPSTPAAAPILPPAQALSSFYDALGALASKRRQEPVTVLHLGDSRTANEAFAGEMRDRFQRQFGNAGRGAMMPGLFPPRDMRVERGGAWTFASSAEGQPGLYGLSGVRATTATSGSWLRLTSPQGAFDWVEATFATGPAQGTALMIVDGEPKAIPGMASSSSETSIRITAKAHEIVIRPRGDGEITLLSIATGINAPGAIYASLELPNASALTPGTWNTEFLSADLQRLKPDLIVLGYGSAEAAAAAFDATQYEKRLQLILRELKALAPQASILVLGPPDLARLPGYAGVSASPVCRALNLREAAHYEELLARKDEGLARWHAPPNFEAVRLALRKAASAAQAYYWDVAQFMGGTCAVHAWSSARPALAAPDHVALTHAGSERAARALYADIMAGYESYVRLAQVRAREEVSAAAVSIDPIHKSKVKGKTKVKK